MGYTFDIIDSCVDESLITAQLCKAAPPAPAELVRALAIAKAERAAALSGSSNRIVIAADTVVDHNGHILGKPRDSADAKNMLLELSGTKHFIYTGLCVRDGAKIICAETISAAVWFRRLDEDEIDAYIATGEPMDKAGAYGIQERGAVFAERIDGDFYAVVGLPVCKLSVILRGLE